MKTKFKLGKIYEIITYDHFETNDKSSQQAAEYPPIKLILYGVLVAITPIYLVLSWNFVGINDENNDNIHIIKKAIIGIRELK